MPAGYAPLLFSWNLVVEQLKWQPGLTNFQSEVLHSHPIGSIPKSVMKAPPLNTSNPSTAHSYLPVPSSGAKLRTPSATQMIADFDDARPTASQVLRGFPPESHNLSEAELDPYFVTVESSIKDLESALSGPMEKVNRRTLSHLAALATDLADLGSKYNAFALSEQSSSLAAAIERVGQAADSSYIATEELAGSLGASFAEPMRENAQFASVVRSVLKYRLQKRVQQEMVNDDLAKKKALLEQLERSEAEAQRIEQYLSTSQPGGMHSSQQRPRRSSSLKGGPGRSPSGRDGAEDTASIDSDFPPTHGDVSSAPSARVGAPERSAAASPTHKKMPSGNSITNKIFGPIRHAIQGVADVDPERSRRDNMGKTKESIEHLEQARVVAAQDVKEASASILNDLKRFQYEKEDDLKRYMVRLHPQHLSLSLSLHTNSMHSSFREDLSILFLFFIILYLFEVPRN